MSSENSSTILKNKSFSGLLLTLSLGAFNDNFFRSAIAALITFCMTELSDKDSAMYVNLGIGLFMLPYFLFSAVAGEISDKFDRTMVIRLSKIAEFFIAISASFFFVNHNISGLMVTLFFMGTQSAFFGPVKMSILPNLLSKEQLVKGNAYSLSGTYLATLLGVSFGSIAYTAVNPTVLPSVMITVSLIGVAASLFIKRQTPAAPKFKINANIFSTTKASIKRVTKHMPFLLTILAASWGWLIASVIVGQLPAITATLIKADNNLFLCFSATLTIGIVVGAILSSLLAGSDANVNSSPMVSLLLCVALGNLAFAIYNVPHFEDPSTATSLFLTCFSGWYTIISLLVTAVLIGMYIVPFESYLQKIAPEEIRARIIGGENIICSLFIVVGSLSSILITRFFASTTAYPLIFLILMIVNLMGTLAICCLLPAELIRPIAKRILKYFFKVKVSGFENLEKQKDKKTIIISNHTGLLDGAIIWTFIKDDSMWFAIDRNVAKVWWIKMILSVANYFTIDSSNAVALKEIIKKVNEGKKVVIFPEGRITTTGGLMKIYPGSAMIAKRTGAELLPICLEGSQYSTGSYYGPQLKRRPHTGISMKILPAEKPDFSLYKNSRNRYRDTIAIYDLLARSKVTASDYPNETLFTTFINMVKAMGSNVQLVEDIERKPLTGKKLILASLIFGKWFKNNVKEHNVGIMLPNSCASVIAFFGLQACGKVPAMLNFSSGVASILSCSKAADIKTVITSTKFIEMGQLHAVAEALKNQGIKLIYLEKLKNNFGLSDKIWGLMALRHKYGCYKKLCSNRLDSNLPAVILFTSGSEGKPKGVVLSHRNIQTNRVQLQSVISFGLQDSIFNAMPMFHSFGLTAGTLLPVLGGIKTFMYPSPLHYKLVPILVYETNATALFGTDTFLKGYAKFAHPYDMYKIRFAVAGGEKLREDTRQIWCEKFGLRIFEGYGATETSPVIAVNTNMFYKSGTVGRLLPNINYQTEEIPGIKEGAKLIVKGNNVMLGYMRETAPGVIEKINEGWYDTGDIVNIDSEGFIKICGRAKRFAKIAGEMVSLAAVETSLSSRYPNLPLAAIACPDQKKGETVVLCIQKSDENIDVKSIRELFRKEGLSDLAVPSSVITLDAIPLNGTGKTDYVKLSEIVTTMKEENSDVEEELKEEEIEEI